MLVVVEGPDGVGKTTVCATLGAVLKSQGHKVSLAAFPGREEGTLGDLVYRLHHLKDGDEAINTSPLALQTLHVAAHIDAIERRLLPLLRAKRTVILDRYWWSTMVYGLAGGADPGGLSALISAEMSAWGAIRPAAAILLQREAPFRHELTEAAWKAVVAGYSDLAAEEERAGQRILRIRNDAAPYEVANRIANYLMTQTGL